ncbi:MAG: Na+/H+ antiporter subunit E [Geminicoccaceae bacterium]|nr:Na+/H+ antiporter subunit E [Geminicoccaceae bacterium]MCS7267393.1 Na+/H+ antiporter subunit E [Geminicoccaceae bacterium]MCX7629506.1 Na+/H+ antiporter subunit E [Geminicoccaceae bacterium]MDW8123616.1 Na+/H+ antiporter subunit E [Geminicoccaceae bacterium]MDW8339957.1 Na+/H+ antiporter subunit E [Geminicoccaceae bacterium]
MLARLFPHPLLSCLIAVVWVLLVNGPSPGSVLMGLVLGLILPWLTRPFWPERPRLRAPLTILEYVCIVLFDICVANLQVAYLVLFRRPEALRSRFVVVPLDTRVPEAIVTLAGTITMTPGTVSCDVSADGRALLVHALDAADPEELVATIKRRYERRLLEIFG